MSTQTPDIQSILAALASQRQAPQAGGQAPGQPYPSSDQQAGYHAPSAPASYGAPPGYAIPQPAASGSMDLSAIRPVNSGTVSIADAIAKAKSYAAEAGVASYDRPAGYSSHNGRGDGRDSRDYRRRSRSKSPAARRENYRENYNPYRDERREERSRDYAQPSNRFSPDDRNRGGAHRNSNGRDRPSSPSRGSGGMGAAGGDDNSETIHIEGNLVGLIIGRQGENLRRIESETGCRVQFLGTADNSPMRQCKITGPRARRADVKEAIDRIIRDTGVGPASRGGPAADRGAPAPVKDQRGGAAALREGEDHMQIMVPDPTVGLIIGRGGETIRDLQERSGCHINIVGESKSINGLRPVNLIGSLEAAQKAKDLIMEIVDSDSRGEGGATAAAPHPPKRNFGGQGDSHSYGHESRSGPPHRGGDGGGSGGPSGDKSQEIIRVPSDAVGMIIGKRGDTIREIQNVTGCKINVSQSSGEGESEREITLIGAPDSISRAKRAIDEKIDAVRMKGSGPSGGGGGGRGGGRGGGGGGGGDHGGYNSHHSGGPMSNSAPQSNPPQPQAAADGSDPYAQSTILDGGYQNYLTMWYAQWLGSAGANAQAPGDASQPRSGTQ
ncbi:unnamed protein product [Parascedosporium putredinis]|uniref:K Homology domain-containing protein n=1 Tax=Parascedosporium putredinis TaxID=1442378 RepID=A0A9P1HCR2_9PEZI|nr:unnamed protein product [Parascedosporium putredinis]CAI8004099.1 unnamed protein product [Parascedosporium putredinis]